jgi:hypothetical protein
MNDRHMKIFSGPIVVSDSEGKLKLPSILLYVVMRFQSFFQLLEK